MMKHTKIHTIMIVCPLMFIIGACTFISPARVPTTTIQPTQTELHTVTPSFTELPTDTLTPTELPTDTSTPTASPTNTQTLTALPIDIPTSTESPTDTPTRRPTYTYTSTPTITATDTFTPTMLSIDTINYTVTSTKTSTATATSIPTPSCPSPSPHAELSVSAETLKVGDILKVTAVLSNEGCGTLGLPQYRLYIQSDGSESIFTPGNPPAVVHYLGVTSGQPDTVEFELTAVASGQATLNVGISFEFHVGYPGPAYWLSTGTQKLIVTVAP